jgi:DUF2939 family protein
MRKLIGACLALAIIALAYWAWALVGAAQLAAVAATGDAGAIMQCVDLPALRHSLGSQIVRAYLKQNPKTQNLGPLARRLAGSVGGSVADALLRQALTPENLATLLSKGRIGLAAASDQSADAATLWRMPPLDEAFRSGALQAALQSYFDGPLSFVVMLDGPDGRYDVHLHLSGTRWLLSGLDIPTEVSDRLAREIVEKQDSS